MENLPVEAAQQIAHLKERAQKLSLEKSWLQLIINLMNRLNQVPGLENTIANLLQGTVEVIGGTNAIVYYFIDSEIHYADILSGHCVLERISDPLVVSVLESGKFIEQEQELSSTELTLALTQKGWTWVFPLSLGNENIGVFKIENMHLGTRDLLKYLPTFFNYAAMILNNEIHSYSHLQKVNKQLRQEITHRLEFERALQHAKEEAERANHAKSLFLANMSHELRTPLNAVLGFSQLMQNDPHINSEQREHLEIINRSGQHLLNLINDVLDMSKIESGVISLEIETFDLGHLVRDISDMMRIRAEGKGLELVLDQSSHFPRFVTTDPAKLRHILINLVGNAIKFTEKGHVYIRLNVYYQGKQLYLLCEIHDTGPGIAPEDSARIFKPFVQLSSAYIQQGTGLGLAITRQYVELMGGKIEVSSQLGQGSCFTVSLPVSTAQPQEIFPSMPTHGRTLIVAADQPDYRLLIVEDQAENRLLLHKLLISVGLHEISEAHNGREALKFCYHSPPHLIFMDHRMPIMDGVEATRRIRLLPNCRDTKIVALTATAFTQERQHIINAGMDEFISKPFRAEEIFACLERLLGLRFIHAEKDSPVATEKIKVHTDQILALPDMLYEELQQSVMELDLQKTKSLILTIENHDKALATWLKQRIDNMDFESIWQFLDAAEAEKIGDSKHNTS
jgi:signal transduction histidine kinase/DNA-binding response OmpR family regulator